MEQLKQFQDYLFPKDENEKCVSDVVKEEASHISQVEIESLVKKLLHLPKDFPKNISQHYIHELEFFSSNQLGSGASNDVELQNKNNDTKKVIDEQPRTLNNKIELEPTIFNKINRNKTTLGEHYLMDLLTQPKNDTNLLNNRKSVVSTFIENPKLYQQVRNKLAGIGKIEGQALWFIKKISPEMEKVLELVYFQNFWNSWLNTQETFMTWYYYFNIIIYPVYGLVGPLLFMLLPYVIVKYLYGVNIPFNTYWNLIKTFFMGGNSVIFNSVSNILNKNERVSEMMDSNLILASIKFLINSGIIKYAYIGMTWFFYLYGIYTTILAAMAYNKIINLIHNKLNDLALVITAVGDLYDTVKCFGCHELEILLKREAQPNGKHPLEDRELLKELWSDVFKEEPSLFSSKGTILKQYYLLKEKEELIKPYFKYIAYLDCWTSVVEWYLESTSNHPLSLPNYIDYQDNLSPIDSDNTEDDKNNKITSKKPFLKIDNFYNVMVENSVANSVQMGGFHSNDDDGKDDANYANGNSNNNNNHVNNLLITGPNASGKSTCIKAIIETIVLGQTICVVPAAKCQFTPFKLINTYLNIPDCQGKESLFQAEMARCSHQIKCLDNLNKNEFSFSIMDEIFVSTNYYEGVSGAYAICKKMSQYPNSLAIITTHFPVLSQKCRDDPLFKTYYFPVESLPDGSIKGTYKLTPGESQQHLAIKMLQLKGFDNDIIDNAKEMYKYLMKLEEEKKEMIKKNINVKDEKLDETQDKTQDETQDDASDSKSNEKTDTIKNKGEEKKIITIEKKNINKIKEKTSNKENNQPLSIKHKALKVSNSN